jgi:catechol 2,3-dioxygenase-like lactoylglutathione lyase family enzyme
MTKHITSKKNFNPVNGTNGLKSVVEAKFMKEQNGGPVFHSVVLLVENVEKSKRFYSGVLGQKIVFDFGRNVVFEGGLAIWEKDYALNLIFKEKTKGQVGASNAEIYFETGVLDELFARLSKEEVEFIHSIREEPWGQRVFRVFDFDGNILEFAESMESVVLRLDIQGLGLNEITKKSKMPLDFIKTVLEKE